MNKTTEEFEAWWADEGEQSLFALNTTTDDDIKILAGLAWEAAIREALAEQELYEPEGRCKECLAYNGHLDYCSKSAIDAAIEEHETVGCESCGETVFECQIAGETESGGAACADCVIAYWKDRATAISTAVMTNNQYHDDLLIQRDYLLDVLDDIASDRWSSVGKSELAIKAIAKCKEKTNEQN